MTHRSRPNARNAGTHGAGDGCGVFPATCEKCGSLGRYSNAGDRDNAQAMHRSTATHRDGVSVALQIELNRHGRDVPGDVGEG